MTALKSDLLATLERFTAEGNAVTVTRCAGDCRRSDHHRRTGPVTNGWRRLTAP